MRRESRPGRGGPYSTLSALRKYLPFSTGYPLFTASNVVEDPAHLGYVLRFVDQSDSTNYFEQTDTTKQVAMPAAHADFGGQLCVTFTGAEYYTSNKAASYWTFYSNGAMSASVVLTQTGGAGANKLIHEASSSFGIQLLVRSNNTEIQFGVYRSTSLVLNATKAALGTPQHISMYVDSGASPSVSVKCSGNSAVTGAIPGTSATPDRTLVVGGRAGTPALGFIGRMAVLGAFSPNTAAAKAARATWIQSVYGTAA